MIRWDFITFGYYNAQRNEARAQTAVARANLNSDKYLLTQQIVAAYLEWLKRYRLLQIEQDNTERAMIVLTAIRAHVRSGLKPGVDSSTASAAYSEAHIRYLGALDNYNNSGIALAAYTGVAADGRVPDTTMAARATAQKMPDMPAQTTVPADHPLLDVYRRQYEQQLASMSTSSRKYLPRVGMDVATWYRSSGISYKAEYPDNLAAGMPYSRFNYLVAGTLTYNLFDLKRRHDELAEGRYLTEGRKNALQTQQLLLNKLLQQANGTYSSTLERLRELPVLLGSARQAFDQQMALYRAGLNTLIDVTNAQYALQQAETNYVLTQDELLQLLCIRAGLNGQLDNFLQNFKR